MEPIIRFFKLLYKGWMKFAHALGKINTAILMTLFYFLFLGFTRIFVLVFRKDLLDSRWKDRPSYWRKREDFKIEREKFLKPY